MNIKNIILIIICLTLSSNFVPAQKIGNVALRKELLERLETDQRVRREMPNEPDKIKPEDIKRLQAIDRENTERMKSIIAEHGFPGKSLVCEDGAYATFILVQHADLEPEFQKRVLPLLEKAVRSGDAPGFYYAYLTDRIRAGENKPQVYGSQLTYRDNKFVPLPIEDETNVDRRRAALGLPPMAEYVKGQKSILVKPDCSLEPKSGMPTADDEKAIRQTIEFYFKGLTTSDTAHLEKAFDTKHGQMKFPFRNAAGIEETKSVSLGEAVRAWTKNPDPKSVGKIISVDNIDGKLAVAKVELIYRGEIYIDYLTLYKMNGEWKIISKVFVNKGKP